MTTFLRRTGIALLSGAATLFISLQTADAQRISGCGPPRPLADHNLLVHCRYVTIEIEQGSEVKLVDRQRSGEPESATLKSGAIYVDDSSNAGRGAFQVQTPDAIASVRGTSWAVDVSATRSSVFVVTGIVKVRRRLDGQSVSLSDGEGVDVAPVSSPLVVKRWPAERVQALLAQFGR